MLTDSPTSVPTDLDQFFTDHEARIRAELFELLRIPSVSARSEHNDDTVRAAEWVARCLIERRKKTVNAFLTGTAGLDRFEVRGNRLEFMYVGPGSALALSSR